MPLPMTKYTYTDDGLAYDVVDVIKLYPEILNNTSWRDATYQFFIACNKFHPYVFDILNIWIREPFGACVNSANIYMKDRYDEVKFNAGFYATSSLVYGYMAPVFGSIGLVFALLTLILIRNNLSLHTPYGIMVFFQSLLLVVLLIENSTVETVYMIQRAQFSRIINKTTVYSYGIFINNDRIDRFMVFVNLSLSLTIALLRLLKTFNRFCVMYFIHEYATLFTKSVTRKICIIMIMSAIVMFLPLVAFPETCKVEITIGSTFPFTTCSSILTTSYMVLRIAIAIIGFLLGILTVIKFRKYVKQNTWSKLRVDQERTLIVQTFCDLIDFTAIFIPLFVYRIVYAFPYVISRIAPYGYLLNLATTRPLTVACFGNCIDSMITLFLLIKIVKLERKTEAIALS